MIDTFAGPYAFLSNFYRCSILLALPDDTSLTAPSVEHAYQALKARKVEDFMRIVHADTAGAAKRLGSRVDMRFGWTTNRIDVMRHLLHLKFQDPKLAEMLVATAPDSLMEGNYWHDEYWGVDRRTLRGDNHLGKLLMDVREMLYRGDVLIPWDFEVPRWEVSSVSQEG